MGLEIVVDALKSRKIRQAVTGKNGGGLRKLALNAVSDKKDDEGNFLSAVYNGIERFGQSLMSVTKGLLGGALSFSFTKLWSWCVSAYLFVFHFNWNATDKELDQQIKQGEIAIAASKGALIGKSLGYAVCGLIPTATIAVFNEPMALYVMKELGEEAAEEIAQSLATLIGLQLKQWRNQIFINLFKNYRSILRPAAIGFANLLVKAGVLTQDSVDKANKNRNEPWSFAGALEDSIDSIKDPVEQAYAEEFWEEFGDACIEAGYIVAGGIDSYLAQAKLAQANHPLGEEKIVEITLDRSADDRVDND